MTVPLQASSQAGSVRLPPTPTKRLSAGPSLLLDVIRFGAALVVAIGHVSQPFFGTGMPDLVSYASGAVGVFFVLSGFVIRYITLGRVSTLRKYTIDRTSRMYSVVLPALALTVCFDAISHHANPQLYLAYWGDEWHHPVAGFVSTALFLSQSWFKEIQPLSNGPFWSISYECAYYAVYGFAFYLTGGRRILGLAITFALIGPAVFLLLPTWLLGCLTYDIYAEGRFTRRSAMRFTGLCLLILALTLCSSVLVHHYHLPDNYVGKIRIIMAVFAIPTALVMLLGCWALDRANFKAAFDEKQWHVRTVRRIADSTFALYLVHLPILVMVTCALPFGHRTAAAHLAWLAAIVLLCIVLAGWFDHLKNAMRAAFSRWWPIRN